MKIIIRKARKGDGKGIAESFNYALRKGFNKYTGTNLSFKAKKIRGIEKDIANKVKTSCIYTALDGKRIIGSAIFSGKPKGRLRHRINVGWGVNPDYTRKGIATKMVSALLKEAKKRGFKRADAEICVLNKGSIALAKKLEFKIEGRKTKGLLLDNGKYADTYIIGRLL